MKLLFNCYFPSFPIFSFVNVLLDFFVRDFNDFFIVFWIVNTDKVVHIEVPHPLFIPENLLGLRPD